MQNKKYCTKENVPPLFHAFLSKTKGKILLSKEIVLTYLLITIMLSRVINIEIIKSVLSLPVFLIFPYFLGDLILPTKLKLSKEDDITHLLILWCTGIIFLVFYSIFMEELNIFNIDVFILTIFVLSFVSIIRERLSYRKKNYKERDISIINLNKDNIIIFAIVISWSCIFPFILLQRSLFPTHFMADEARFILGALKIMFEEKIPQFNSYFPYLSLLLAISSKLFDVHPVSVGYVSFFFINILFSLGVYLFTYEFEKEKISSLIAALVASSVFHIKVSVIGEIRPASWILCIFPYILLIYKRMFDSRLVTVKYDKINYFIFLLPFLFVVLYYFTVGCLPLLPECTPILPSFSYQPFVKIFMFGVMWLILFVYMNICFDSKSSFVFSLMSASLIFLHTSMSIITEVMIFSYIIYLIFPTKVNYKRKVFFYVVFTILLGGIILSQFISFSSVFNISYYGISLFDKIEIMIQTYTPVVLLFSMFGIILLFLKEKERKGIVCILYIIALSIVFFNYPILIRALGFLTPFISYTVGYFLNALFKSNVIISTPVTVKREVKKIICILLLTFFISSLFMPISSFFYHVKIVSGNDSASTFSYEEYIFSSLLLAGDAISNEIIISDPYTQLVISGLSGRQHIGELFMSFNMRDIVKKIITTQNSEEAYKLILLIKSQNITTDYSKITREDLFQRNAIAIMRQLRFNLNLTESVPIIVITPRTIEWCKNAENVQTGSYIWENMFPKNSIINCSSPSFKKFFNEKYFELLFKIDGKIYVFKAKC